MHTDKRPIQIWRWHNHRTGEQGRQRRAQTQPKSEQNLTRIHHGFVRELVTTPCHERSRNHAELRTDHAPARV